MGAGLHRRWFSTEALFSLVFVSALVVAEVSCARNTANYRTMHIDPKTLKVQLEGNLPSLSNPTTDYFFRFGISGGRYTVDHFGPGQKIRYDAFFVNADDSIVTRTKYQVLLSGPFGTVYAETTYYYASEYTGQSTQFFTVPYSNKVGHEPFQIASSLPSTPRTLSAISIVRVFSAAPEFLIVSANYAPDGHLEALHVNGSENGDWVHSNTVHSLYPELDVATSIGDRPRTREIFGLPERFPVERYIHTGSPPFEKTNFARFSDVVNMHYDRNRWVQQDAFLADGAHQIRFLTYKITDADEELASIDNSRAFGQVPRH